MTDPRFSVERVSTADRRLAKGIERFEALKIGIATRYLLDELAPAGVSSMGKHLRDASNQNVGSFALSLRRSNHVRPCRHQDRPPFQLIRTLVRALHLAADGVGQRRLSLVGSCWTLPEDLEVKGKPQLSGWRCDGTGFWRNTQLAR